MGNVYTNTFTATKNSQKYIIGTYHQSGSLFSQNEAKKDISCDIRPANYAAMIYPIAPLTRQVVHIPI
jgi:hypothetical protein